ncbi:hypothetical protein ACGFMK_01575 [Amycolatopsis sp. NPDC049252]|uniref:hypothetical protein n=1 Tax=Amycolatopsis sp. NPDC049252 TaxID=3363933 RepID=UPI00371393A5
MNTRGNSTRTAALIVVAVLAFVTLLGGGAWLAWRIVFPPVSLPAPPTTLPSPWPEQGAEAVRAVPMPTGEMVAALPDYTASHVLCSSLPEPTWAKLLGGPVLREVNVIFGCQVVTTTLRVSAKLGDGTLVRSGEAPEQVTVGGRPATSYQSRYGKDASVVVRLLGPSAPSWSKPVLEISVSQDTWDQTARDLRALAQNLGDGIVNAVTAPGPALPQVSYDDSIPPRTVGPTPGSGIVDASTPMIAWQLCSLLAQSTQRPLTEFVPKQGGKCEHREDDLGVQASSDDCCTRDFPDRIRGRPALVDNPRVVIRLGDASPQQVELAWTSPRKSDEELRAWAESMVSGLLGR